MLLDVKHLQELGFTSQERRTQINENTKQHNSSPE